MSRSVVVTGLGVVTPVGVGVEQSWKALLAGESGFKAVESGPLVRSSYMAHNLYHSLQEEAH